MNLSTNLSDFNRRLADAFLSAFLDNVQARQSDDGMLLFRGLIPLAENQTHIGTHVAVSLDNEVMAALSEASPANREKMTEILINNLGTQVRYQYNPNNIGSYALGNCQPSCRLTACDYAAILSSKSPSIFSSFSAIC